MFMLMTDISSDGEEASSDYWQTQGRAVDKRQCKTVGRRQDRVTAGRWVKGHGVSCAATHQAGQDAAAGGGDVRSDVIGDVIDSG